MYYYINKNTGYLTRCPLGPSYTGPWSGFVTYTKLEIILLLFHCRVIRQQMLLHGLMIKLMCLVSSDFGRGYEWNPKSVRCHQGDIVKVISAALRHSSGVCVCVDRL